MSTEDSCITDEADAFIATRIFSIWGLERMETDAVTARIKKLNEINNDQLERNEWLKILDQYEYSRFETTYLMIDLVNKLVFESWETESEYIDQVVVEKLKEIISNDDYYKEQCQVNKI